MAITVQSFSTVNNGNRSNTSITAPTGITNGDLLVICMITGQNPAVTPTPPSGFTAITGSPFNMTSAGADPYKVLLHCWIKTASGESGSYGTTHGTADTSVVMFRLSGQAGTPVSITPVFEDHSGAVGGSAVIAPTITTTVDGSLVIWMGGCWDGFGATSPPTGTTPTYTEYINESGGVFYVAAGVLNTAGATGAKTVNAAQAANKPWLAVHIVIDASAGGGETETGAISISGTGGSSITVSVIKTGNSNMSARSNVNINGGLSIRGSVITDGKSSIDSGSVVNRNSSSTLDGKSSTDMTGQKLSYGTTDIAGKSDITTGGSNNSAGAMSVDGRGSLNGSVATSAAASIQLASNSELKSTGAKLSYANIAFSSTAEFLAVANKNIGARVDWAGRSDSAYIGRNLISAMVSKSATSMLFVDSSSAQAEIGQLDFSSTSSLAVLASVIRTGILTFDAQGSIKGLGGASYQGSVEFPAGVTINDYISVDRQGAISLDLISAQQISSSVNHVASVHFPGRSDIYISSDTSALEIGSIDASAVSAMSVLARVLSAGNINFAGGSNLNSAGGINTRGSAQFSTSSEIRTLPNLNKFGSTNLVGTSATQLSSAASKGAIVIFDVKSDMTGRGVTEIRGVFSPGGVSDMYANTLPTINEFGAVDFSSNSLLTIAAIVNRSGNLNLSGKSETVIIPQKTILGNFNISAVSRLDLLGRRDFGASIDLRATSTTSLQPRVLRATQFSVAGESYLYVSVEVPTTPSEPVQIVNFTLKITNEIERDFVITNEIERILKI